MWSYYWFLVATAFSLVSCELHCNSAKTCGECIGRSFKCVWCPAVHHNGSRCQTDEYHAKNKTWCRDRVHNPQVKNPLELIEKALFSSGKDGSKVVQITPQKVTVTTRPGKTESFTVGYQPAEDYPLDVFYLLDTSYTMNETLSLLQTQGKEIYSRLSNYTSNLRLGVGSFVEKKALPYAGPLQKSYAFKKHLALTNDSEAFKRNLQFDTTGANYDTPEAGLDALMQVMVCKKELDWRSGSRKIVVMCTDSTYHSAGDGKMAGAAKLNDMQCHLDANGTYDRELEQDYPTVNQINKVAKEKNTIVIFNVFKTVKAEYESLAKKIKGAEYVELKEEASSIVETIAKVYAKSVRHLQMSVHKPNENVVVSLYPDCTKTNVSECAVTPERKMFSFQVSIRVDECITREEDGRVVLRPVGLGETLSLRVQTLCACDCEKHGVPNAKECGGRGSLQCGICKCNENSFGDKCECTGDSATLNSEKCRAKGDRDLCSGHGTCRCGECKCDDGFSGAHCQFDDNGCARAGGVLCGGRGRCHEGACDCERGWSDDACQCTSDTAECIAPHSQNICSGNGFCKCGKCVCTKLDSKNANYTGTFCDYCHECDEVQCKELEKYARCFYFKKVETCNKEMKASNILLARVNQTDFNDPKYYLAKLCKVVLENDKSVVFKHQYKGRQLELIIQNELEEPDRANMFIAIGSCLGIVLLLGLLTVIAWKILVDLHDKREYDRFSEDLNKSVDPSNINALYVDPTANFQNPNFRRSRMW